MLLAGPPAPLEWARERRRGIGACQNPWRPAGSSTNVEPPAGGPTPPGSPWILRPGLRGRYGGTRLRRAAGRAGLWRAGAGRLLRPAAAESRDACMAFSHRQCASRGATAVCRLAVPETMRPGEHGPRGCERLAGGHADCQAYDRKAAARNAREVTLLVAVVLRCGRCGGSYSWLLQGTLEPSSGGDESSVAQRDGPSSGPTCRNLPRGFAT